MKRFNVIAFLVSVTMLLSSCEVVKGIFKAGVWSGIILVVIVIALIIWLFSKFMGGNKN